MSEMSYLEKLLDGVEVEWKTLEDISIKISSGGTPKTGVSEFYDGDIPWLRTQEVNFCDIWDTEVKITESGVKNSSAKWIPKNCVIVAMYGATVGKIGINKIPMTTNQACANIQLNEEVAHYRYVFHFLCSQYTYIKSLGTGSQTNINAQIVKNIKIPIPCPDNPEKSLAIQSEIVRILDKFTALTAELTAELAMRKKQYNYYRDQLLSFEEGEVEWKTLGDIGDVRMCKRILKNETLPEGDVPFYKIGTFGKKANAFISRDVFEAYKNKYSFPKKGDVLISASGTIGRTVIYDGEPAYFQDSNIVWLENDESIVTNKYLWHFYKIAKWAVSEGGTIDRLYNDNIRKTKIIVPYPSDPSKSLAEQNRVVAILEKFDALTSSISEGLPREIELRQKQYEYYRDLLFSFPKPEAASN
ncbi:restriction endonuclease subunit S [Escherichia coli]|uniref:restriction endonuclease subunit S n=1 Tax=Escherichia coli TaxID=562 RepID=UPI000BEACB89|nr:restriction endonuclease subunit S [Escherichia coli]EDV3995603.1 restriction endonuclease subunit S [Salmonella enterica subsp. enterica serovar Mbandaka]EEW1468553.1 restriction endonuclease subunit S [Escherichia coli]EEW1531792.1 restriction endonuclease subunit S [Escherichia coli]EEW1971051.1 restriction endonuclease subunit S [Escherichia coli]EEW2311742.1 restriction endonuclease subunit S [Escherichia coli]